MKAIALCCLLSFLLPILAHADDTVVAEYRGTTVTRAELGDSPGEVLREKVIYPAIRDYLLANRSQWQPDAATVDRAIAAYRQSRACANPSAPPESAETERYVATALLTTVSAQGWLHRRFGGGRLLFQQSGVEAFDATYRLLHQLQAEGAFRIHDPGLLTVAYEYWRRDHGPALLPASQAAVAFDPARLFASCEEIQRAGATPQR